MPATMRTGLIIVKVYSKKLLPFCFSNSWSIMIISHYFYIKWGWKIQNLIEISVSVIYNMSRCFLIKVVAFEPFWWKNAGFFAIFRMKHYRPWNENVVYFNITTKSYTRTEMELKHIYKEQKIVKRRSIMHKKIKIWALIYQNSACNIFTKNKGGKCE